MLRVRTSKEKRILQNYITYCEEFLDELESGKAKKLRKQLNNIKKETRRYGVEEVKLSLEELEEILSSRKKARVYFVFAYFSGLRLKEVLMVKELLAKGENAIPIDEEHGYLPIGERRGFKIATVAFSPLEMFEALSRADPVNYDYIKKIGLARKLREHWFQRCISIIGYPELCSWMQGRVSALGVSEAHYLDLLNKAKLAYPKIARALRGELREDDEFIKIWLKHIDLLRRLGYLNG